MTVRSNGGLLQCNFNSYNGSGNLIASVARYTCSTVATNLYFSLSPSQVGFNGTFNISCYLPPSRHRSRRSRPPTRSSASGSARRATSDERVRAQAEASDATLRAEPADPA